MASDGGGGNYGVIGYQGYSSGHHGGWGHHSGGFGHSGGHSHLDDGGHHADGGAGDSGGDSGGDGGKLLHLTLRAWPVDIMPHTFFTSRIKL